MQKAIVFGGIIAAAFVVAPQAAAQIQPGGSGAGKFCLQPKAGGPPRCFYQTMADCQVASNQGTEGSCSQNPAITTGSGTGQ
jgi:hypothetical protein